MNGRRSYAVVLASGIVLSFAFPEPNLWPLAWLAPAPFLYLLANTTSARRGARLGALFGVGFFGTLLVWVSIVGWLAWAVLIVVESAFVAGFGALCAVLFGRDRRQVLARVLVPPVVWVAIIEHLRSLVPVGGFTWGQIAQSQHDLGWLLRAASVGGGWLVTFLVILGSSLIAEAYREIRRDRRRAAAHLGMAAVVLIAPVAIAPNDATGPPVRVALVQGNVPREFDGSFYEKERAITENHRRLTEELADDDVDVVFWPESSVGLDVTADPDSAADIAASAEAAGAPMVIGANLDTDERHYQVVALHVTQGGEIRDIYVKTHLVPFGEYVPMRSFLDWIPALDQVPRDAVPSDEVKLFDIAGGELAPVLSYEGDFGALVRRRMDDGGRMLLVATNTSTWGDSWASAQHLAFSQVRAAETGVWVAHAAISGISAVVGPEGNVVETLPLWEEGTIVADIRYAEDTTIYARTGEWLPMLAYLLLVGLIASQIERALKRWRTPKRDGGEIASEALPFE